MAMSGPRTAPSPPLTAEPDLPMIGSVGTLLSTARVSEMRIGVLIAGTCLVAGVAACQASPSPPGGDLPAALSSDAPYRPQIDPTEFSATVDNAWFPLAPGTRWVLRGSGDAAGEIDHLEVLSETRTVMGVECVVVEDVVSLDGEPVEITQDWYAQDTDGNVWYFGEETAEYENGQVVSTAGAWEAGVDGAQPGIIMPAAPVLDVTYRQEYFAGEAEDMARAIEVGASAETPYGAFDDVLVTEDWTPLEPDVVERKYYARGIGLIMERQVRGGSSVFELVEHEAP